MATATEHEQQDGFDHAFDSVIFTDPTSLIHGVLGVEPELDAEYDLTRIDRSERVQARLDKNNAPAEMVEKFVHQMSFSQFPPFVVTSDGVIVDGNTRCKARLEREERFTPVLVVPVAFHGADDDTIRRLEYLGLALNSSNGKQLTRAEQRRMVKEAFAIGMSGRQITATVGLRPALVASIRTELVGEERLQRAGFDPEGMKSTPLRALGRIHEMSEPVFVEFAALAVNADLSSSEISALAASIRELDDELAIERINRERETCAIRIEDVKEGRKVRPPVARQLRQRLGFVAGRPDETLVERDVEQMAAHRELLEEAITKLQHVLELQLALEGGQA